MNSNSCVIRINQADLLIQPKADLQPSGLIRISLGGKLLSEMHLGTKALNPSQQIIPEPVIPEPVERKKEVEIMVQTPEKSQTSQPKSASAQPLRTRYSLRRAQTTTQDAPSEKIQIPVKATSQEIVNASESLEIAPVKLDFASNSDSKKSIVMEENLEQKGRATRQMNRRIRQNPSNTTKPPEETTQARKKSHPRKKNILEPGIFDLDAEIAALEKTGKNVEEYLNFDTAGIKFVRKKKTKRVKKKAKSQGSDGQGEEAKTKDNQKETNEKGVKADKPSASKKIRKRKPKANAFDGDGQKFKLARTKGGKFKILLLPAPKKSKEDIKLNPETTSEGNRTFLIEEEVEAVGKTLLAKDLIFSNTNSGDNSNLTKIKISTKKSEIIMEEKEEEQESRMMSDFMDEEAKDGESGALYTLKAKVNASVEIGEEFQADITPFNTAKYYPPRKFKQHWNPEKVSSELLEACDNLAVKELTLSTVSRERLVQVLGEYNYSWEEFNHLVETKKYWMRNKLRMKKVWNESMK